LLARTHLRHNIARAPKRKNWNNPHRPNLINWHGISGDWAAWRRQDREAGQVPYSHGAQADVLKEELAHSFSFCLIAFCLDNVKKGTVP
jgi:hypothetical protein